MLDSVEDRFNEILGNKDFVCTQEEFNTFNNYGYLFKTGNKYVTRSGRIIDVSIISPKSDKLTIDLTSIMVLAQEKAHNSNVKRVFCMNQSSLDKYKECGMIIEKNGNSFFRVYDNELWLVVLI